MNVSKRRELCYWSLTPELPLCVNCEHYYQHYQQNGEPFASGHCCFPRLKLRKDYDTCEHFKQKNPE